jgi:hypothetical protein
MVPVLLTSVTETGAVGLETVTQCRLTGTRDGYKTDIRSVRNVLPSRNNLIKNFRLYEVIYYLSF